MILLPELPYAYGALAPVMSETTLRFHHDKHHARYVDVANSLLAELSAAPASLEAVVVQAFAERSQKLFNNAAQAWNHGFFWACMTPALTKPSVEFAKVLVDQFGSLESLKSAFINEAANHFGSGWAWLAAGSDGKIQVLSTHDADTVIAKDALTPLLVCDLWEHAYYLDHQNNRAGFLASWWDTLVDWDFVETQFKAMSSNSTGWLYPVAAEAVVALASAR